MQTTYYIYHIPGKKIGVSIKPKQRVKAQGYLNFVILEEHTDIMEVSRRELELQKEHGYEFDNNVPYWKTVKMSSKGGSVSGVNNSKRGWIQELGKRQGLKNKESGHLKELLTKNGLKSGKWLTQNKPEHFSQMGKIPGNKVRECQHCNIIVKGPSYHRWHGDNCKKNPITNA